jgi:bifunctional non-homologous end joining protein LigD
VAGAQNKAATRRKKVSDEPSGLEYVFGDITVTCTNVDRIMFPADGIKKSEVIGYYHFIADYMLPEIRERAISVERYTKGIDSSGFFQKHYQKHYPAWLDKEELGVKTRVVYPIINTTAGLVYLANQGSIAFHIWPSRRQTVEYPDLLVFDLDPPEGRFDLVRSTALILRELLEEDLALPAFVKTTGSKGLHVVSPLDGRAGFGEVSQLCNRIAKLLCARHPDKITQEFYKKDRKGRLFFDTLRNALGATLIAPWSLRGRPARRSRAVGWDGSDRARRNGFKLREVRKRIDKRGDPWEKLRSRSPIDDADSALDNIEK